MQVLLAPSLHRLTHQQATVHPPPFVGRTSKYLHLQRAVLMISGLSTVRLDRVIHHKAIHQGLPMTTMMTLTTMTIMTTMTVIMSMTRATMTIFGNFSLANH